MGINFHRSKLWINLRLVLIPRTSLFSFFNRKDWFFFELFEGSRRFPFQRGFKPCEIIESSVWKVYINYANRASSDRCDANARFELLCYKSPILMAYFVSTIPKLSTAKYTYDMWHLESFNLLFYCCNSEGLLPCAFDWIQFLWRSNRQWYRNSLDPLDRFNLPN